jgi:hypothetical protein
VEFREFVLPIVITVQQLSAVISVSAQSPINSLVSITTSNRNLPEDPYRSFLLIHRLAMTLIAVGQWPSFITVIAIQ